MKQLKFNLKSSDEFTSFLKKFSSIQNILLLDIDDGYLKAKTHTPERSVVKSSKVELSKIFSDDDTDVKVSFGIFNLDKLSKAFAQFGNSPIEFILDTEETSDGTVGTNLLLRNDKLEINYQCASLRLFTKITDEMMDKIAGFADEDVKFVLSKDLQAQIHSLSNIDSDQKILNIEVKNGNAFAKNKTYNLNLTNVASKTDKASVSIYKTQFSHLDKEDHMIYLTDDKLIFHSLESDTKMIIGKVE